ncbi:hydroxymyristoyl-ACP dehydratase [uncultured Planktosalinus sp.]|uniref:3-hydroxyacyl-ACP dehydratase FabZ family protein n=1 Tax=uncultured Planktosalinus sp. TaxID=1810935 RepID=UPI0030DCCD8C
MTTDTLLKQLPYGTDFLFVDSISQLSEEGITGHFRFKPELYFYKSHFMDRPVTPGVILIECMAQIGLVCLGIYLLSNQETNTQSLETNIALSTTEIEFFKPVYPGEKVTVVSEKEYFRFGKLKCKVKMMNEQNELVSKGSISGMILK